MKDLPDRFTEHFVVEVKITAVQSGCCRAELNDTISISPRVEITSEKFRVAVAVVAKNVETKAKKLGWIK